MVLFEPGAPIFSIRNAQGFLICEKTFLFMDNDDLTHKVIYLKVAWPGISFSVSKLAKNCIDI